MDWATFVVGLSGAVAWPLAVALVVFWLRVPLRGLIDRIRKWSAAGMSVEMDEMKKRTRLEQEVGEAAHALDLGEELDPIGLIDSHSTELRSSDGELVGGTERRRAVEELVQRAADWGHARGLAGYPSADAEITWDGPWPRLTVPDVPAQLSNKRSSQMAHPSRGYVANLEERVKELEAERAALYASGAPPTAAFAIDQQLRDAKEKLQAVQPDSGLL